MNLQLNYDGNGEVCGASITKSNSVPKKENPMNQGTLVARVRSTYKGKNLIINGTHTVLGGVGVDARRLHEIRKVAKGKWTCSCEAFKYHTHGKPCKHMLKLWNEYRRGTINPTEVMVLDHAALVRTK